MIEEFVQNISTIDVDVKNYRIKDFGALRKENSSVTKSLTEQRAYLDTGLQSQLVSLDGIESYDEFWDRIDTLFFTKFSPNVIPKQPLPQKSTSSIKFGSTQGSSWFNTADLKDRLFDSLIPEDFEISDLVKS